MYPPGKQPSEDPKNYSNEWLREWRLGSCVLGDQVNCATASAESRAATQNPRSAPHVRQGRPPLPLSPRSCAPRTFQVRLGYERSGDGVRKILQNRAVGAAVALTGLCQAREGFDHALQRGNFLM